MATRPVLFYIFVLFFCHQQSEIVRVSGEKPVLGTRFEHVHPPDSLVPAPTCQSTLPPGIGRDYGVPLIPSRGPCSPLPPDRNPSRVYTTSDSVASRQTQKKPGRGGHRGDRGVHITHDQGQYLVPVRIGSQGKLRHLIMDTGSDVTWTWCEPLIAKSSTFSKICPASTHQTPPCGYTIKYRDGSSSRGYNAQDSLVVNSKSNYYRFPNYKFGCNQSPNGDFGSADGILGLAMKGTNTFLSQIEPTLGKSFCICIPPTDSSFGYLLLGDEARGKCKPEASTPLIDNLHDNYVVNLRGITFNNETLDIASIAPSSPSETLIDSGTTATRLHRQVYKALRSKFRDYMSKYRLASESIFDTCYKRSDYAKVASPKIVLHFDQADLTLHPKAVVLYIDSVACFAFSDYKTPDDMNIVGSNQMRNVNVLFDASARKIGFGRGNCGS